MNFNYSLKHASSCIDLKLNETSSLKFLGIQCNSANRMMFIRLWMKFTPQMKPNQLRYNGWKQTYWFRVNKMKPFGTSYMYVSIKFKTYYPFVSNVRDLPFTHFLLFHNSWPIDILTSNICLLRFFQFNTTFFAINIIFFDMLRTFELFRSQNVWMIQSQVLTFWQSVCFFRLLCEKLTIFFFKL